MKKIFAPIAVIVIIVSAVAFLFTYNQAYDEQERLENDIQYRSTLLADSLKESVEPNFINKSDSYLQNIVEKFVDDKRLAGLAIVDNKGEIIAVSSSLPKQISEAQKIATDAMDSDTPNGDFENFQDQKMYVYASVLHDDKNTVVGSLIVIQNAGYIDTRLQEIWKNSLLRLFMQVLIVAIAAFFIIRWFIFKPIQDLSEFLESIRKGGIKEGKFSSSFLFFHPLEKEIANIRRSLMDARIAVSEEARLSLEKLDSPWTSQRLKEFIKNILKNQKIYIVSNREPYIHTKKGGKISFYSPASGMVTAIEPVMKASAGVWIAYGSGDADHETVDGNNNIQVPPDEPEYTLHRIWLTKEEEKKYYYGFSNEGIWPLCHNVHVRPVFKKEDWIEYKKVNEKFAESVLSQIENQKNPIIWIQDFQLSLVPKMIKEKRPDIMVGIFWHIPWPNSEAFSICPWKKDILDGILGADLIGFHIQLYCNNFVDTVSRELESRIDYEHFTVTRGNHTSLVKPFPASVPFTGNPEQAVDREKLLQKLNIKTKYMGIGVDRLDYTKGILERLKAIEIFLGQNPQYLENFTFIQISTPSRSQIKKYKEFDEQVEKEVERINSLYKKKDWKPITLQKRQHTREELDIYYKAADFCLVTSLHDGMNLVSKEFVAARSDDKGVLILSQFAGSSKELKEAILTNPYNGEQTARAIKQALEMPEPEQKSRMIKMRSTIKNYNTYRWSAEFLKSMATLE